MRSMICHIAERLLVRSQDVTLLASEADLLAGHIGSCAFCQTLFLRLTRQSDLFRVARETDPGAAQAGAIASRAIVAWDSDRRSLPTVTQTRPAARHAAFAWTATSVAVAGAAMTLVAVVRHPGSPRVIIASSPGQKRPGPTAHSTAPQTRPAAPIRDMRAARVVLNMRNPYAARRRQPRQTPFPPLGPTIKLASTKRPTAAVKSGAIVTDDLAAINADPSGTLNRWAQTTLDEWAALEARVRATIHQGDDFVKVPFPQVAMRGGRTLMGEAIEEYRRQVAIVDPRLQTTLTIAKKGVSFEDLCELLRVQTGIDCHADSSVADDKITIFSTDKPLRDIMGQISRLFGYTWRREGAAGAYRYTLEQGVQAQLLEEDLRNRDRNAALAALDADMQGYRPYLQLTPDEAFEQAEKERKLQTAASRPGSHPSSESTERLKRLDGLSGSGWAGIQLYFHLTPQQRATLDRMDPLVFKFDRRDLSVLGGPTVDAFSLPLNTAPDFLESGTTVTDFAEKLDCLLQSLAGIYIVDNPENKLNGGVYVSSRTAHPVVPQDGVSIRDWSKRHLLKLYATMQIKRREMGKFELSASTDYEDSAGHGTGAGAAIGTGVSPSSENPDNAARNRTTLSPAIRRALESKPAFRLSLADLHPSVLFPAAFPFANLPAPPPHEQISYADALEALHTATEIDIIADYYTRLYDPDVALLPENTPLCDGLNRVADSLGLHWGAEAARGKVNWLTFRDAGFFKDRTKEVSVKLLDHWAADRRTTGTLPLTDLREIAELSDVQLDSTGTEAGAERIYNLQEWNIVTQDLPRPLWRFLQSLPPEQQDAIWSPAGLAVSELTPEQQSRLLNLSAGLSAKATRLYGEYHPVPGSNTHMVHAPGGDQVQDCKLDIDFRHGDTPCRIGMGSYGF